MEKKHLPSDLASNDFFKESDSVQVKYELIRAKATTKKSVVEVCQECNFSRRTFYEVKKRFDDEGLVGLVDKLPGPRSRHKVDSEMEKAIIRIKREHMNDSMFKVPQVFKALEEEYAEKCLPVNISPKTVERVLIDHGLHTPRSKKNSRVRKMDRE
ncbi:MAG: helix-turn-helix domain-containing protein [Desulfitobacteriaceae bacterium]|nr:helix-turn-helix domain-containing protein [Desulfitobacteriaceae bacterium]MDD4402553.1 helix-turn-helix domain-containing protein [Desulfitobacteriaceae bacterium]